MEATLPINPRLSAKQQLVLTAGICALFALLLRAEVTGFLLPLFALASVLILRNPRASVFAFMVIDLFLIVRGRQDSTSLLDIMAGFLFVAISGYWIVRIRLLDWQPLTDSRALLTMITFFGWSILVTAVGLLLPHHDANDGIRELLNLLPLVILPILYSKFVPSESTTERGIFLFIPIAGVFLIGWNIHVLKSHILKAVYLFQMGRAANDASLSLFLALLSASLLMVYRKSWKAKLAGLVLLASTLGVVISLARSLYLSLIVGTVVLLILGSNRERKRAAWQWTKVGMTATAILIPILATMRLISLMLMHYVLRFSSAKNLKTDLSLVNRYVEWHYLLQAIKVSPIVGYGFGARFRGYSVIEFYHYWLSFSHSSYLYIVFKTGLVGAVLFFGAYLAFTYKGYRLATNNTISEERRAILRAGVAFLVAFLVDCYASPDLDSKTDMVWIGLLWGFFLATETWLRTRREQPSGMLGLSDSTAPSHSDAAIA